MSTVYIDVGNTLNSPFTTGIQRFTREVVCALLDKNFSSELVYRPIVFDAKRRYWRSLQPRELQMLLSGKPRSADIVDRAKHKLRELFTFGAESLSVSFEQDSVFLDIENSWHSDPQRKEFLPELHGNGTKIVKIHYDLIPVKFPESMPDAVTEKFIDHFLSHVNFADKFLCISLSSLEDVISYCRENCLKVPNAETIRIGASFSRAAQSSERDMIENQFGRFILMVGTIEPRKNHELLLEAYEQISEISDLSIVFVGKKGWLTESLYQKIITHNDYGSRIHLLLNVEDEQLRSLYQSAWISVFPSRYEGYGLPIGESLSLNCPTICSDTPAHREVGGTHVRYFPATSAKQLADLLRELFNDPGSYLELSEQAKKYSPMAWSQTAKDIDQILKTMLA